MKIFITGGTGFIGTALIKKLIQEGHEITVLTRAIRKDRPFLQGACYLVGNPTLQGTWQERVTDHDAIINMAGASIFKRWTRSTKKAIRESRILTTQNLVEAISARKGGRRLFLSSSAVGYYGFHEEEELYEDSPPGDDFLASITQEWESSALKAQEYGVQVLLLRFGVVIGKNGGALRRMIPIFNKYLGSPLGSGKQWFPWIHEQDIADIFLYLLEQKDVSGPINCTAPNPVRNKEMAKILGEVLGKPTFVPAVPAFVIKMVMGESGSIFLKGQKALPARLLNLGFHFSFPEIRRAFEEAIH